jgi:GntR family transcriptional regulator
VDAESARKVAQPRDRPALIPALHTGDDRPSERVVGQSFHRRAAAKVTTICGRGEGGGVRSQVARPKYERLRGHLRRLIDNDLAAHDRLPTERDLAEQFGVSRVTVRRALDDLENEHRVYRVQGAGTFVAATPIAKTIELTSFSEDMRLRGLTPASRLLVAETVPAGAEVGVPLRLSPADEVVHLERVRTADGVPMCLERAYLAHNLVPGLLAADLAGSLYEVLEDRYHIRLVRAEQRIRATVLVAAEAALLDVPPFTPALLVERTSYDQRDRPVERACSTYRADRYSYQVTLHRGTETTD